MSDEIKFIAIPTILLFLLISSPALAGTTFYKYDDLYRLTQVERSDGTILIYQYDEIGNRSRKIVTTHTDLLKGDINVDKKVDLLDVVLGLQVISGRNPADVVALGDVDGNKKIGMEEVLYAFHAASANEVVITTLQPGPTQGKDTYYGTFYFPAGHPDGGEMRYGGWGDWYYDYIQFDISVLPLADMVSTAKIYLYSNLRPTNDPLIDVRIITEAWAETSVTNNSNPTSTYYKRMDRVVAGWNIIDITSLYRDWKTGNSPNYGIKLSPTYNWESNGSFYSSDYSIDPTIRPKLVIEPVQ